MTVNNLGHPQDVGLYIIWSSPLGHIQGQATADN